MASSLKCASRRGLTERFDGSIGAASVLMPFGGSTQRTPAQVYGRPAARAARPEHRPVLRDGLGLRPRHHGPRPLHRCGCLSGGPLWPSWWPPAVTAARPTSLSRSFLRSSGRAPALGQALLRPAGALDAQLGLDVAAIGGKDSMSGSFLDLDVPPTLISFAIAPAKAGEVLTPNSRGGAPGVPAAGFPSYGGAEDCLGLLPPAVPPGQGEGRLGGGGRRRGRGGDEDVLRQPIGFQADVDAAAPGTAPARRHRV